ncbi:glycerol-3-phosphate dehydrogenase [NAD+] [Basidiobolus meristosporus CBS 931.73]|uniref:Glycerol-3-phosphate dehydrogenase [NAD(+)] n=1 Tax=Basidiobolus meristosporus CBS 931.73 TaxID=1314790 RepID=A0A1Y1XXH8_9FUNG|nr:glycerol-3-phosphate dehydrogenase [NAD+] [Basidiobolus meristosporus CBS 931.73]|eukprot:ORX90462.1 glycerol-3-phosphate dehydrogenase [NAD+] [Basidiobolus meristosporus CBS 931.73]
MLSIFPRHTSLVTRSFARLRPSFREFSLSSRLSKEKVCVVGSGNWGTAVSKILANNVLRYGEFDPEVRLWVHEEISRGEKLSEVINQRHENVKYLPNIQLPTNLVACPDLRACVKDATVIAFVVPHQFLKGVCADLVNQVRPDAKAISLIKGIDASSEGVRLFSEEISGTLGIETSVLSGANIAQEVALEHFCETTIGSRVKEHGEIYRKLFNTEYFRVTVVDDVAGVELCGALKNIVAIGAGIVDGLKLGDNTKAAIMRIGLMEIIQFAQTFYSGVKVETFFESCGVADLITTCAGGRNRRVAEAHVLTGKPFHVLEKEMLHGQKLQGTLTAKEVHAFLAARQLTDRYPLFTKIHDIVYRNQAPSTLVDGL